jgi:hypothetical protein
MQVLAVSPLSTWYPSLECFGVVSKNCDRGQLLMLRGKWGLACLAVLAFAVGGQLLGNPVSQTRYAVVPIQGSLRLESLNLSMHC